MSKAKDNSMGQPGKFCWNELAATNQAGAKKFYRGLFGWKAQAFAKGQDYTVFKQGKDNVGGMMKCPQAGLPAQWLPYVTVADVDKTVANAKKLGAKICMYPLNVAHAGRIAVLVDPQGAALGIITPKM